MEIINMNVSNLSNFEVMEFLIATKDMRKKSNMRNLATVSYEILQYLEEQPCKHQTRESITAFLNDVKKYRLKLIEYLMMVNDPPTCPLHIQLLIDESSFITEENATEIITLAKKHFPTF